MPIDNMIASATNLIDVINRKQWERLDSKVFALDSAVVLLRKYRDERKDQLHSLRLAVLEYANMYFDDEPKGTELDLALSAGIVFENGTWILKEGEK